MEKRRLSFELAGDELQIRIDRKERASTGKLTAAVHLYSYEGVLAMDATRTTIATNDSLWLHTGDWTTPDAANIANLDLTTLVPRFVRGIKLTDATAAVREKLGL